MLIASRTGGPILFKLMLKRRKTRELAMQVLFLWDTQSQSDSDQARQAVAEAETDDEHRRQAIEMAHKAWEQRESIDRWIEKHAPQWPPRRQPGVDRSVLRLAVWELTNAPTPPKVVIDEAIELAKQFSTEQSPAFINGVLDAILKEVLMLKATERRSDEATDGRNS